MLDIIKHVEHFLSLGGENNISIGSDFDGCELPSDIKGGSSMDEIYEMFLMHNYKESVIRKIFYENALNFFENFDNPRIM
jgi:membrane dipeptidase